MKNKNYKFFNTLFLKVSVSVSAKVSAISGIGIGEYLSIGIGGNFGIGAALPESIRRGDSSNISKQPFICQHL